MTPYLYNPLSFIAIIADNLGDRYRDGFPILKELVQNADDAGASSVDFVVMDGLPEAANPLLRGPALVCVNDGIFLNEHAKGIVHMALSSKSDDAGAIGKFGLGQKAVFHLCEAFLFMASPGEEPEDPRYPRADIVDPWAENTDSFCGDRHFPEWNQFDESDRRMMTLALASVLGDRWFILWVPLRREDHKRGSQRKGAIIPTVPNPDRLAQETADEAAFAELLPFLANVRTIRSHRSGVGGVGIAATMEISVAHGDARLSRKLIDGHGRRSLSGRIVSGGRTKAEFAGVEEVSPAPALALAQKSDHWPVTFRRNELTCEDEPIRDKSVPHAAAAIFRNRFGGGTLRTRWAVYLPLDDSEQIRIDLPEINYTLLLHGCFFVDAGRRHVHGLDDETAPEITSQDALRRAWNIVLRDEGSLALVPAALDAFRKEASPSIEETSALCRAILGTDLWRKRKAAITARHSFVLGVSKAGVTWLLAPAAQCLRPIPVPPEGVPSRPWDVLPKLGALSEDLILTFVGAPNLRQADVEDGWTVAELEALLTGIPVTAVTGRGKLNWLTDFLQGAGPFSRTQGAVGAAIIDVVRRAILEEGAEKITGEATAISRLLRWADQERILLLPDKAVRPEVLTALAASGARTLALRDDMRPEGHSSQTLSETDGMAFLTCLDGLIRNGDDAVAEAAGLAATRVFRAMRDGGLTPHGVLSELKVIRVRDEGIGKTVAVSCDELMLALSTGTLFLQNPPGLQKSLQSAIAGVRILSLLGTADEWSWLAQGAHISQCNVVAALAAVAKASALASPSMRTPLVKAIASSGKDAWCDMSALRYLLHGDLSRRDDISVGLIRLEDAGLEPVAAAILRQTGDEWRLIPAELQSGLLSSDLLSALRAPLVTTKDFLSSHLRADRVSALAGLELSESGREAILEAVEDRDVWLRLPFHRLDSGAAFSSLDGSSYLEGRWPVPPRLKGAVKIASRSMSDAVLMRQTRFLDIWSPAAQVLVALAEPEPWRLSAEVMDGLAAINEDLSDDLRRRLKSVAWIPCGDRPAAPCDILDLPAPVMSAAQEALGSLRRDAFMICEDVDDRTSAHPEFGRVVSMFGASGEAALIRLALGLDAVGGFPCLPTTAPDVIESGLRLAGILPYSLPLPGWPVLAAAVAEYGDAPVARHLAASFSGRPERAEALAAMKAIATAGDRSEARLLFKAFLEKCVGEWGWEDFVPELLFPNAEGDWLPAQELAVQAEGVLARHILHRDLACDRQMTARLAGGPTADGSRVVTSADDRIDEALLRAAPQIMRDYFSGWIGKVPPETIGTLVAILGDSPGWRGLAEDLLGESGRSIEAIRAEIGGAAMSSAVGGKCFAVRALADEKVSLTSIAGNPFWAPLKTEFEHIFAGHGFGRTQHSADGGYAGWIDLRRVDLSQDRQTLSGILGNSLRKVLQDVYARFDATMPAVDAIWEKLAKGSQIDILAARRRVEDGLEDRLDMLKLSGAPALKAALRRVKDARKRAEEVTQGDVRDIRESEYRESRKSLAEIFGADAEVQSAALTALRKRIGSEFAYNPSRVPFELFQNADDAAVELLEVHPDRLDAEQIEMHLSSDALTFIHFGRPVNHTLDLSNDDSQGYGCDLEKMLLIAASDKALDGKVTGRFGFGFKCVHLVTDRPHILSSWLRCDIVGGLLPIHATNDKVEAIAKRGIPGSVPTVIHLPARSDGELLPESFCAEFIHLAGMIPVFAKRVRELNIRTASEEVRARWRPRSIPGCELVAAGDYLRPDKRTGRGIKFTLGRLDLFLVIEAGSVGFLPADVPTIWCTAPTTEQWGIGYAINGRFSVDVGRTQLSSDTEENALLLEDASRRLGSALVALFDAMTSDLNGVADVIGLGRCDDEGFARFWRSLFDRFSVSGKRPELTSHLQSGGGLAHLCSVRAALPTGLSGPWAGLVTSGAVRTMAEGALRDESVLEAIAQWPETAALRGHMVSRAIASRMAFLGLPDPEPLTLGDIVESVIGGSGHIDAGTALRLGRLINDALETGPCAAEFKTIQAVLVECMFLSAAGSWRSSKELWAGEREKKPDLAARSLFAPASHRLDDDYQQAGMDFFHFVRRFSGFRGDIEVLAGWARDADTEDAMVAVLSYVSGPHGHELADELKQALPAWIGDEEALRASGLLENLPSEQVTVLMERLFPRPNTWPLLVPGSEAPPWHEDPPKQASAELFFARLAKWWGDNRDRLTSEYEGKVYPGGVPPVDLDDPASPRGRDAWFTLLSLGSFHTMGRVQDGQHRGFLQLCRNQGWWRTFVETSPSEGAADWMDILERFSADQTDDQEFQRWIRSYVDFYRINRWLEPIALSLLSLERRSDLVAPSVILSPAIDPGLSRGGWLAPTFIRTLGIGYCFVVREAARLGAIGGPQVFEHCWMPNGRVRELLRGLGCYLDDGGRPVDASRRIASFVRSAMPGGDPTFDGGYDLPLQIITRSRHDDVRRLMLEDVAEFSDLAADD